MNDLLLAAPPPLAHFSGEHWWTSLLYFAPLLIILGTILREVVRDRRRPDDRGRQRSGPTMAQRKEQTDDGSR